MRSELGNLMKVTGRGWGNETFMEMTYVVPQVWLSFTMFPPAGYWASMTDYMWVDSLANAGEAWAQHPQVLFHYVRYTADLTMAGYGPLQISTQEFPAIFMYRNLTPFPLCAITRLHSTCFKERDDLNEALRYLEGMSSANYWTQADLNEKRPWRQR